MEVVQIIIILFALFALSRAFLRLRQRKVAITAFTFWTIVWAGIIFLSLFPGILSGFAKILGISSGTNLLVIFGVVTLFYLIFRLHIKMNDLEREMTKLVQKIAIEKKK